MIKIYVKRDRHASERYLVWSGNLSYLPRKGDRIKFEKGCLIVTDVLHDYTNNNIEIIVYDYHLYYVGNINEMKKEKVNWS